MEMKYNGQRAIIKRMEENILELHTRLDRVSQQNVVRSSASMSSGTDIGNGEKPSASPHSSPPLSVSLTSSEGGSMAFLQTGNTTLPSDVEIKNLQVIIKTYRLSDSLYLEYHFHADIPCGNTHGTNLIFY